MIDMSGPMLFLRYAYPCAYDLLAAKKISQNEYEQLERWAANNMQPDVLVLEQCFPKAVAKMDNFRQSMGFVCNRWNHYVVEKYWRHYHDGTGDCAVRQGEIFYIHERVELAVMIGKSFFQITCLNLYNLKLIRGEIVFFHRRVIAEKAG